MDFCEQQAFKDRKVWKKKFSIILLVYLRSSKYSSCENLEKASIFFIIFLAEKVKTTIIFELGVSYLHIPIDVYCFPWHIDAKHRAEAD